MSWAQSPVNIKYLISPVLYTSHWNIDTRSNPVSGRPAWQGTEIPLSPGSQQPWHWEEGGIWALRLRLALHGHHQVRTSLPPGHLSQARHCTAALLVYFTLQLVTWPTVVSLLLPEILGNIRFGKVYPLIESGKILSRSQNLGNFHLFIKTVVISRAWIYCQVHPVTLRRGGEADNISLSADK